MESTSTVVQMSDDDPRLGQRMSEDSSPEIARMLCRSPTFMAHFEMVFDILIKEHKPTSSKVDYVRCCDLLELFHTEHGQHEDTWGLFRSALRNKYIGLNRDAGMLEEICCRVISEPSSNVVGLSKASLSIITNDIGVQVSSADIDGRILSNDVGIQVSSAILGKRVSSNDVGVQVSSSDVSTTNDAVSQSSVRGTLSSTSKSNDLALDVDPGGDSDRKNLLKSSEQKMRGPIKKQSPRAMKTRCPLLTALVAGFIYMSVAGIGLISWKADLESRLQIGFNPKGGLVTGSHNQEYVSHIVCELRKGPSSVCICNLDIIVEEYPPKTCSLLNFCPSHNMSQLEQIGFGNLTSSTLECVLELYSTLDLPVLKQISIWGMDLSQPHLRLFRMIVSHAADTLKILKIGSNMRTKLGTLFALLTDEVCAHLRSDFKVIFEQGARPTSDMMHKNMHNHSKCARFLDTR